ncbi:hypothetical protein CR513_44598, partial [Mucuna pruriens]
MRSKLSLDKQKNPHMHDLRLTCMRRVDDDLPQALSHGWLKIESTVEFIATKWWMSKAQD